MLVKVALPYLWLQLLRLLTRILSRDNGGSDHSMVSRCDKSGSKAPVILTSVARYVEEGAHIEEWNPLCQYQSDKAVDDVSCLPFYVCWNNLLMGLDYRKIRRGCQKASLSGR